MTIRIHTARLLELIADLTPTTHPDTDAGSLNGILLHSGRGYHVPGEPGLGDILVGTSTTGRFIGHTYAAAFGRMTQPMLWPADRAKHVASWFKTLAKDNADHTVELGYDGKTVQVKSIGDPMLFDHDGEDAVEFAGLDVDKFPRGLWDVLRWDTVSELAEDGPMQARSDLPAAALEAFAKVAGKRPVEIYRFHPRRPILIGIGDRYRGAIYSERWEHMDKLQLGRSPFGEVHDPELPEITRPQVDPESLLELAAEKVVSVQLANTGMLVRSLRIKTRAAETLLDQLEMLGVISEDHGGRGRDVLAQKNALGAILDKIRAQQPQQPILDEQAPDLEVPR